jgi:2-succinyl-5-enolpyruvyl-6-hydroxy-3-cyclohexene-1-carboxylate synthase
VSRGDAAAEPPATRAARALVTTLVAQGVRDVVLCPGSRSAPLAYALVAAHDAGWLRLHVRADERSAAFLALGLTRAGEPDRPAVVVTTSGTAVANLHPAVLEASHAGRPLIALTADRPHELRRTGANQTTDQVGIFGGAVRWSLDLPAGDPVGLPGLVTRAIAAARGLRAGDPGPVHVNAAFREPLTPVRPWTPAEPPSARPRLEPAGESPILVGPGTPGAAHIPPGRRSVVVAGDGAGPAARRLAELSGWPLLAEPTSGARSGPNAVGAYRLLLDVPELGGGIERVVVVGRPTLSRPVSRLLAREDVEIVVVGREATWTDVAGTAALVCGAVSVPEHDGGEGGWLRRWQDAAAAAANELDRHLSRAPLSGLTVAREVARATEEALGGARTLVVGASMAVRDLDLVTETSMSADPARVLANRGLAGIDGTIATAAGVALGSDAPVRVLVGDLTFLHDLAGLARGPREPEPDLQVVVVNDDGGAIFATVEHGDPRWAEVFERVFATPQGADLAALCRGYGVRHTLVPDLEALRTALGKPIVGRSVVEVQVSRQGLREGRAALATDVASAARRTLAP